MSQPQYSNEDLIANIKRRCSVPTSQLTFTPEDFVLLANDTLQGEVVPLIMSAREEYFVTYTDIQAVNGVVDIPDDATGSKLRTVAYLQSSSPLVLVNLPRIDLDIVAGVNSPFLSLAGFYIQGNKLQLYPSQSLASNCTIRLYYYKRTLVLAEPDAYGQVIAVDVNSNTIQLSNVPSSWVAGTVLNSVAQASPFDVTASSIVVTNVSSPTIEVDSVAGIAVGDYVSEAGFSAIPQVPVEAHGYLAQLTAVKVLEALGDTDGMQSAMANANKLKSNLMVMISQRVDGSPKKVINPNGFRRGVGRFRRY